MGCKSYKSSAPGSMMLFGEHAVLFGNLAIVAAVNHYIHVELIPSANRNIHIVSSEFDEYIVALDKFIIANPYNYVLTAIKQYLAKIKTGFMLRIVSEFPADIGFGSSAAITVAILQVLALWLEGRAPGQMYLYKKAVKIVRLLQGVGSGADVAASIFGGVIAYKIKPLKIQKFNLNLPLVAVYSGSKTTTPKVIAIVEKKRAQFLGIFADLYTAMEKCTVEAITALKKNDLMRLGQLMNIHQGLQDAIGVSNAVLAELIFILRSKPNIYGSKISGAGMGDCVLGLGKIAKNMFPQNATQKKLGIRQIKIAVSRSGIL